MPKEDAEGNGLLEAIWPDGFQKEIPITVADYRKSKELDNKLQSSVDNLWSAKHTSGKLFLRLKDCRQKLMQVARKTKNETKSLCSVRLC